jgi:subtilisin family serine protease
MNCSLQHQASYREVSLSSQLQTFSGRLHRSNEEDSYEFRLSNRSIFDLKLSQLQADVDIELRTASGKLVERSNHFEIRSEDTYLMLDEGTYVVQVSWNNDETPYTLQMAATSTPAVLSVADLTAKSISDSTLTSDPTPLVPPIPGPTPTPNPTPLVPPIPGPTSTPEPTPTLGSFNTVSGTLGADRFEVVPGKRNVFSGNGNFQFGQHLFDTIDLSKYSSTSVKRLEWANPSQRTGEKHNFSNGARLLDSLALLDNTSVLFEGIEVIKFADKEERLWVGPNDPLFPDQWNLHMTGVHNAWDFTKGSDQVLIGIADSGLGTISGEIHPDLGDTFVDPSNNQYQDDYEEYPKNPSSHGTQVQSVVAAKTNNSKGMSGINWNSSVIPIDSEGISNTVDPHFTNQSLSDAVRNMIAESMGRKLVINISLGDYQDEIEVSLQDSIERKKLEDLIAQNQDNVLFLVASGNIVRNELAYPASLSKTYSNVISVGGVIKPVEKEQENIRWINPVPQTDENGITYIQGSTYGEGLTLMAPTGVTVAEAFFNHVYNPPVSFDYSSEIYGTSVAAPHVTGIASLVWSANLNLTASQVKDILSQTAYDLGTPGYDIEYGNGLVNADAAVRRAIYLASNPEQQSTSSLESKSNESP